VQQSGSMLFMSGFILGVCYWLRFLDTPLARRFKVLVGARWQGRTETTILRISLVSALDFEVGLWNRGSLECDLIHDMSSKVTQPGAG